MLPVDTAQCDYIYGFGNFTSEVFDVDPNLCTCHPLGEQYFILLFIQWNWCSLQVVRWSAGIAASHYSHFHNFPSREPTRGLWRLLYCNRTACWHWRGDIQWIHSEGVGIISPQARQWQISGLVWGVLDRPPWEVLSSMWCGICRVTQQHGHQGWLELYQKSKSDPPPLSALSVVRCWSSSSSWPFSTKHSYPIQKVTEIYNKVTELYNKVTELENSSWNVLSLLRSEVPYIGTGHILP